MSGYRSVCFRTDRFLLAASVLGIVAAGWPAATTAASGDIVLYASDVTTIKGAWTRTSSTSGAGGQLMNSSNAGWSQTSAPLASPANYFEVSFPAAANTPYHVWLRLRAASNSKFNDSVWVQFNQALNTAGSPVWRIGTTSGLLVNLEGCKACGMSGWGWADSAWWTADYAVVKFSSSGTQTLRVQTREDGVQIDQIVLSPTAYFTAAPGPDRNDSTVIAKPATSVATTWTPAEVVLYASDAARRTGNWTLRTDSTAALGKHNGSDDHGWYASSPSSAPADFLEWSFNAVAGVRYRTWLRLRATGDSKTNDSVWVQFTGSVDAKGSSIYRIGTTSALGVNLENCSECGVSGWGWQRRSWWMADTGDVYFATSGTKTIRVQTREDGVRLDQIVLSPSKFATASPGPVRNDTTLVNRNGTTTVIGVTSSNSSTSTSTTYPKTLTFTASADHNTLVLSYRLDLFTAGSNPATAKPAATLNLGKPAPTGGVITSAIGPTVQALAPGSYVATVSAVGSAGVSRSAPSSTFSR